MIAPYFDTTVVLVYGLTSVNLTSRIEIRHVYFQYGVLAYPDTDAVSPHCMLVGLEPGAMR